MVSTRSSARKPPKPSRPSTAPPRLPSQTEPTTPLPDGPPPSQPRRSRRIKLKNADSASSQPPSPESSLTTSLAELPDQNNQSQHVVNAKHSDDDEPPEEIETKTIDPRLHPSDPQTAQQTAKKKRRRRNRERNRRKKHDTPPLLEPQPASLPSQDPSQLQALTSIEQSTSTSPVPDRLSEDAIAHAQNELENANKRENDAERMARLENQVKRVARPNMPQQIGRIKVALLSDTFPLSRRPARKGRQSPASFLASCIEKGPRRVPASKIAMMARSKRSVPY